jgi:hypothetical protein
VRSPITATLPQIGSRLFLVWGILWSFPEVNTNFNFFNYFGLITFLVPLFLLIYDFGSSISKSAILVLLFKLSGFPSPTHFEAEFRWFGNWVPKLGTKIIDFEINEPKSWARKNRRSIKAFYFSVVYVM